MDATQDTSAADAGPGREFDREGFVRNLPSDPGVYRMLDTFGRIIYVGKARNLKRRVSSYFRDPAQLDAKTRALMQAMRGAEITVTRTETEALLLENNLIKEYRPRYNVVYKDDKSYPYIYLDTEHPFPRLRFHRGARSGKGRYFGPYASAGATRSTLNLLQKLFQVRQCRDSFFDNRSRPCLQHQIKRCTAPCVELVGVAEYADDVRHAEMFLDGKSEEMIEDLVQRMEDTSGRLEFELAGRYRDQIRALRRVQTAQNVSGAGGDTDIIVAERKDGVSILQVMMIRGGRSLGSRSVEPRHASGASTAELLSAFLSQHYLRGAGGEKPPSEILLGEPVDGIEAFEIAVRQQSGRKVSVRHSVRGERAAWLSNTRDNARLAVTQRLLDKNNVRGRLESLRDALDLDDTPERIECFDISHTMGEATVASCVVFGTEGALKSDYRRFNIRSAVGGDDYGAMREALQRRYTRVKREEGKLPDLLLIDGGKGQLSVAVEVLEELQLSDMLIVSVAKGTSRKPGLETLFIGSSARALVLEADSLALHLVQQVRDEAHRFAITGHRARRAKVRGESVLESIPGIGSRRRQRLLKEFGGLQGLRSAGVEDLSRVQGISHTLARQIVDVLRET